MYSIINLADLEEDEVAVVCQGVAFAIKAHNMNYVYEDLYDKLVNWGRVLE